MDTTTSTTTTTSSCSRLPSLWTSVPLPFPCSLCFEVYFPTSSLEFFPSFPCSGGGGANEEGSVWGAAKGFITLPV